MGYTTEFEGRFRTSKKIPAKLKQELTHLAETRHGGNMDVYKGFPGFWCQWVPSADGLGIEWDGGEKFYHYADWLQLIIDRYLTPNGIALQGRVLYRGESSDDVGYLIAEGGHVRLEPLEISVTR